MNERTFVVIFLLVTVIAIGGLILNRVATSSSDISASPSPSGLVFNNQSSAPAPTSQSQVQTPKQSGIQQAQSAKQWSSPPPPYAASQIQGKVVVIKTAKGSIAFQLDPAVPEASSNFMFLTINHFYDGLTFHRVEPGFVIQGGDPSGNGTGGPGYSFKDELTGKEKYTLGIVAMANAGPNTNGSQFFIMLADQPNLPPNYTIFGHVVQGQDVVSKIAVGDVMQSVQIEQIKQ